MLVVDTSSKLETAQTEGPKSVVFVKCQSKKKILLKFKTCFDFERQMKNFKLFLDL